MTEQSPPPNRDDLAPDAVGVASGQPPATKTPLFQANHADRYQRQILIKQIQNRTKRTLICYVSGSRCVIDENDTMPLVDLLHRAPPNRDLDLSTPHRRRWYRRR